MTHREIVTAYLNGAAITYPCRGYELGMILNRFANGVVHFKHENDATWDREPMSRELAAYRVPSDARLAA